MNKYKLINRDLKVMVDMEEKIPKTIYPCLEMKKILEVCLKENEGNVSFCTDMRTKYEECLMKETFPKVFPLRK